MCISCGCGAFEDKHGDERNITLTELKDAAAAANINMGQLSRNIHSGLVTVMSGEATLAAEVESMNEPLPSGQFADRLETTPYPE
jgi:hypothetical protein